MTELRKFLQYAENREAAYELQREYAGRLAAAGLTPEYLVDAVKPRGSMWRIELVTDTDETPGDEGADRWLKALFTLQLQIGQESRR